MVNREGHSYSIMKRFEYCWKPLREICSFNMCYAENMFLYCYITHS